MENTIEEIKIKYSRVKGKINPYDFNIVCKMSTSYEYKSRLGTCLLSKDKNYNTYQAELFIRVSVNEFATRLYRFAIIQSLGDMFSQLTKLFKPNSIVKIAFPKRLNNMLSNSEWETAEQTIKEEMYRSAFRNKLNIEVYIYEWLSI